MSTFPTAAPSNSSDLVPELSVSRRIEIVLQERGQMTTSEIVAYVGIDPVAVRANLSRLVQSNRVERIGKGLYGPLSSERVAKPVDMNVTRSIVDLLADGIGRSAAQIAEAIGDVPIISVKSALRELGKTNTVWRPARGCYAIHSARPSYLDAVATPLETALAILRSDNREWKPAEVEKVAGDRIGRTPCSQLLAKLVSQGRAKKKRHGHYTATEFTPVEPAGLKPTPMQIRVATRDCDLDDIKTILTDGPLIYDTLEYLLGKYARNLLELGVQQGLLVKKYGHYGLSSDGVDLEKYGATYASRVLGVIENYGRATRQKIVNSIGQRDAVTANLANLTKRGLIKKSGGFYVLTAPLGPTHSPPPANPDIAIIAAALQDGPKLISDLKFEIEGMTFARAATAIARMIDEGTVRGDDERRIELILC